MLLINILKKIKYTLVTKTTQYKYNKIYRNGRLLGNNVLLGRRVNIANNVTTGNNGYIGQFSYIGPKTEIGDYFIFADNVNIIGCDHEFQTPGVPILVAGLPKAQPKTKIGTDVWLGHGVVVMRGCKVGDGAIVAASSVVTKDVEPYSIYAGIPAVKIKDRFESDIDRDKHREFIESLQAK
jgi:acetyltransferase-like isoleucine patch superfamily enzyme